MLSAMHRGSLGDWMYFLSYKPNTEVVQVAAEAGLNEQGRRLLYRTDPHFVPQPVVEQECDVEKLGCINESGRVFILNQGDNRPQMVVTAAHEMLHLAYRRLSEARRRELQPLIEEAIKMNDGMRLESELRGQATPEDRYDEAHSLLATEYRKLPVNLEAYYAAYFSDRAKVVAQDNKSEE